MLQRLIGAAIMTLVSGIATVVTCTAGEVLTLGGATIACVPLVVTTGLSSALTANILSTVGVAVYMGPELVVDFGKEGHWCAGLYLWKSGATEATKCENECVVNHGEAFCK